MESLTYQRKRGELTAYFDRTAAEAWARLTSDAPVSRIRATVRAGRDGMRDTLLSWLPQDLTGTRVLDAGCGTGALSVAAARRGADVLGIDLSPTLLSLAAERLPTDLAGSIRFAAGDMLDPAHGTFDHVVAMDSIIYHAIPDLMVILETLAARTRKSILFTFAPRTPALGVMHAVGQLFPRGDRSPAIVPVSEHELMQRITSSPALSDWVVGRTLRIKSGFYISHAVEVVRQ
jgi:magnesium-protoporphyrin O-methyltransferase